MKRGPERGALAAMALVLAIGAPSPVLARAHHQAAAAPPSTTAAVAEGDQSAPAQDPAAQDPAAKDPAAKDPAAQVPAAQAPPSQDASAQSAPEEAPSDIAVQMARWVTRTNDNGQRPFVIVDKVAARIFVFDPDGLLLGSAPALVGLAQGDDSAAGVGDQALSAITPDERTTPAGRFVAGFGAAIGHHDNVLWVDYADAISLHPVVTTNPSEHRLKRIKSVDPEDHRISFGCINVPASFYSKVVLKAFAKGTGIVYILPDTRPIEEVFPVFAADERATAIAEQNAREAAASVDAPADRDAAIATQSDQTTASADPPAAQPAEAAKATPTSKMAHKPKPGRRRRHPHPTT